MDSAIATWLWVGGLGGAGGAASVWLARQRWAQPVLVRLGVDPGRIPGRLAQIALASVVAGGTAAGLAWMIGRDDASDAWFEPRSISGAAAFFWVGFVTAGWIAAERDKLLLRLAVCRAATAPAAHPDTIEALAHASPDAVYEAVTALVPRRGAR